MKAKMRDGATGKNVAALVEEQLQYCRSLRLANMLSMTQNVATNEECLKQANSLIMILKADVRALNSCAVRLLAPSEAGSESETSVPSEVARSAYNVETVERLFRRFRQVETGDSSGSSAIKAVSSTNQLVTMKSRLQAGLSARLLELKAEMDKEFGMAFVDMESYLRTEKDTQAKSDAEHCSACARSFVELCYKFQVMVHACRGLRAAKEGLSQTVLLKALREERDALAQRLADAETDLKKIHHNYTEIMTPEVVVGLENRQRHKIGEQEADLARLKAEIYSLRRDHERLLAENGRFSDAVGELQSQLHSSKEQYGRELAWLNPRVVLAETRGVEIEGLVDQMNLRLSLLGTSQKKAAEEIHDLKAQLSLSRADERGTELAGLREEVERCRATAQKTEGENSRKERLVLVAMMARAEAQKAYEQIKLDSAALEQRYRDSDAARTAVVREKEELERRLEGADGIRKAAEAREAKTEEELRKVRQDLELSQEEVKILEKRLRDQEMELRDFSNLQDEMATLKVIKADLVSRVATVSGNLEDLKQKAIGLGMGKQLGLY